VSYGTFLRFPHTIDIYTRKTIVNPAGQRTVQYSFQATIDAMFQSISSERRVAPYIDNVDEFQFYIPAVYSSYADYGSRISNVLDRYSEVIEAGPFEIINIQKKIGFNSRVTHILLTARKVVEVA
jgi:hypothetical protein